MGPSEAQIEILDSIDPMIKKLTEEHVSKYPRNIVKKDLLYLLPPKARYAEESKERPRHWLPSQILPPLDFSDKGDLEWMVDFQKRAKGIPDSVRVALALNIITEEGLPHFHRILAQSLGQNSSLSAWNNLWTAEEDTHGTTLGRFALYSGILEMLSLETEQFEYLRKGFTPRWIGNPWKLFVYTSLQEMATKVSHENTGKIVEDIDPLFNELTGIIARDEAKHYAFYMKIFKEIIQRDPNETLKAATELMPSIDMPAVAISNFTKYADVVGRLQIYTLYNYIEIVSTLIKSWGIDSEIQGLDDYGKKAQDEILKVPERVRGAAEYFAHRRKAKSFSFPVIYGRTIELN